MFQRSMLSRCCSISLCAAAIALPQVVSAQVVVAGPTVSPITIQNSFPLSDEVAHAMVAQNFASVLQPGAEENQITLIVDANGNYVTGKASKAVVIRRTLEDGQAGVVTTNDSTSGVRISVLTRHVGDDQNGGGAAAGAAFAVALRGAVTDGMAHGIGGLDVSPDDVATVGVKRIAAGTWRDEALTVTVIKLK